VRASNYILSAETGIEVLFLLLAGELKILGFHTGVLLFIPTDTTLHSCKIDLYYKSSSGTLVKCLYHKYPKCTFHIQSNL
jgi:hypothetical protein